MLLARMVHRVERLGDHAMRLGVQGAHHRTQPGGDAEIGRGLPGSRDQMTKHASSRDLETRISLRPNG